MCEVRLGARFFILLACGDEWFRQSHCLPKASVQKFICVLINIISAVVLMLIISSRVYVS